jgi:heptosyltransferase-2
MTPRPEPIRVLLLLPNWLGDSVMATPLIGHLHEQRVFPDGRRLHLTAAVREPWAPLFEHDPRLDDLLLVERAARHSGLGGLLRLASDFRRQAFDAAILGPPSLRAALAAFLARIPLRVGYGGDGRDLLLNPCLPRPQRGLVHHAGELLALGRVLLDTLGGEASPHPPELVANLEGCREIAPVPEGNASRLVLATGATYGSAKNWPLERAAEYARLALDHGAELVVMGDAQARNLVTDLSQLLGLEARTQTTGAPGLVDLAGRTTLVQVVSLLKGARGFVGNDSGLMHLAAALGVPTIGVFGSSNPDWTAPLGPRARAVAASGFDCRPCYLKACNQPRFCLDSISGQQVWQELLELMDQVPGSSSRMDSATGDSP